MIILNKYRQIGKGNIFHHFRDNREIKIIFIFFILLRMIDINIFYYDD